jgi:predicted phage terminase large subunit-like protein
VSEIVEHVITLRAPHEGQERIAAGLRRFNFARMGRRWGKSSFGVDYLATDKGGRPGALHGYPVAWFAPTNKYLLDSWQDAKDLLKPAIVSKHEQHHRMRLLGGGVLEFWSLEKDDPARGRKYAKVVVDEAAMVRKLKEKWYQAIRPTLVDYKGGSLFASTPKGKNEFYQLERELTERTPGQVASFNAPTTENPYISEAEIEEARRETPSLVFRQEYLGEYVDFGGGVLQAEWLQTGQPPIDLPIVLGVDLAISVKDTADYSAIVAMSREPRSGRIYVIGAYRFRAPFNEILKQITMAATRYKPVAIGIENNQFQTAVVQELLRTTQLPVQGLHRDKDKLTSFMPLAARYEQGMVYHGEGLPPEFQDELLSFTGGPDDMHDDLVDAESNAYMMLPATETSVASAGRRAMADIR